MLFLGPEIANLISLRLLVSLFALILLSRCLKIRDFAQGIGNFFLPLKLFGVDTKALSLSIVLALNFIPILMREAGNIESALRLKGIKFSIKNFLTRPQVFLGAYFRTLFERVDAVANALSLKGYE